MGTWAKEGGGKKTTLKRTGKAHRNLLYKVRACGCVCARARAQERKGGVFSWTFPTD